VTLGRSDRQQQQQQQAGQAQHEQAAAAAAAPAAAAAEGALQQAHAQIAAYRAAGMDDEAVKQAMSVSVDMLAASME
jgi:hypothetical protein